MFSIYTSGFNLIKGGFNFGQALRRFARIADEVVIAVNKSEDDTLARVEECGRLYCGGKLKIVSENIPYTHPEMDGMLKDAALQRTSSLFKIGLDLDEYIPYWQIANGLWDTLAEKMLTFGFPAAFVPVVNLYGDEYHVSDVGQKWYIHRSGYHRGVVNFAKKPDGTHDITKSDGCELLDGKGDLAHTLPNIIQSLSTEERLEILARKRLPFVVHTGYVNLERRAELNRSFWNSHWKTECGEEVSVPTKLEELTKKTTVNHRLSLRD
jgi:hypothetical protein